MKIEGKEYKLPKRFKDKWIKALRSGKYTQGKYKLKTSGNKFCCLGVICEITGNPTNGYEIIEGVNNIKGKIPKILLSKENYTPKLIGKLVKFNDDKDKSFNWIAYYIERYL